MPFCGFSQTGLWFRRCEVASGQRKPRRFASGDPGNSVRACWSRTREEQTNMEQEQTNMESEEEEEEEEEESVLS